MQTTQAVNKILPGLAKDGANHQKEKKTTKKKGLGEYSN